MTEENKMNNYEVQESLTFYEEIRLDYLHTIVSNFDAVYPLLSKFKDAKTYKVITDKKSVKTILEKRLKNKSNEFTYKCKKIGRMQPNGYSLCSMNKVLRHTLAGENHYDIDIVSAHPTFLLWIAKKSKWSCKNLENYVVNRDEVLKQVMCSYGVERDDAKDMILSMMFNQNAKIEDQSPLYDFHIELKNLQDKVAITEKEIFKKAKTDKGNQKGSCLANFLQTIENKICQVMLEFCRDNNIRVSAPCFDGFLANKEDCDKFEGGFESLKNRIELYVKEVLDISIMLSSKPMTMGIQEQIISLQKEQKGGETEYFDLSKISDQAIGSYIIEKMINDEVIYYDETADIMFYYDEKTCLFVERKKQFLMTKIQEYAMPYLTDLGLFNSSLDKYDGFTRVMILKIKSGISSTAGQRGIFTQMELRLPLNSDFINKNFNKTPHLFPIRNNRVVDFIKDEIRDRVKTDYFTFSIDVDYDQNVDEKNVVDWLKNYIIPRGKEIDNEDIKHINCFLNFQGYLATGENNLKVIGIYKGPNDTAKSFVTSKINETFGIEKFVSMVHKKVICESRSSSNHESELFNLKFSRIGFLSELKDTDKANEDFIKRVSGNDRYIPARKCGSTNQTSLLLDFKMIIPTNNIFECSDKALQSRLIFFEFMNVFDKTKDNTEIVEYTKKLDVASVIFKRAHKFYKNNKTIEWSNQVKKYTEKELNDLDPMKFFLNDFFIQTDDEKDRVSMNDVFDIYRDENHASDLARHKNKFFKKFEENLKVKERYRRSHWTHLKIKPREQRVQVPISVVEVPFEIEEF